MENTMDILGTIWSLYEGYMVYIGLMLVGFILDYQVYVGVIFG